ncbi:hypothetical protein ACLIBG_09695 [Virgibacillus sp. W0181]|uniref:hypothetical protein n=1 Tax=Virgibacillus sp. W0181 TaxID=3391581 RepID=UPI003F47590B
METVKINDELNDRLDQEIPSDDELISDDVSKKDHLLLLFVGFFPFIVSVIWFINYIS